MKLLITSATPFEIAPLRQYLNDQFWRHSSSLYQKEELEITLLETGVGMVLTAFNLGGLFTKQRFDLAINAGIAGAFPAAGLAIGDVVNVVSERFADFGVEEADGRFTDIHELGLVDGNAAPFTNGELLNPAAGFDFLPTAKGLTINKVHGYPPSIAAILSKYPADVESMEGASFFLACLLAGQPFMQLRAISNFVEKRNRETWDLPKSIKNLNEVLIELVGTVDGRGGES